MKLTLKLNSKLRSLVAIVSVVTLAGIAQTSSAQEPPEREAPGETRGDHELPPVPPVVAQPVTAPPANLEVSDTGCDRKSPISRTERLAVVNNIVNEATAQIKKHPESIKNIVVREKVGTFAAGSMSDSTLFVSLDRWCWAEFYEAQQHLEGKRDADAFESAQNWKVCLEASFPDRIDLAKPFFSCFPSPKKSKSKTK